MPEETSSNVVNKHYLDKVMDLAEERDIEATEDIYTSQGMKLVAKGSKISRSSQEKLILHRLRKPLESSIAVEGSVNIGNVIAEAKKLSETIAPVGAVLRAVSGKGPSPFDVLAGIKFGSAMGMMLTITERGGPTALAHSVMVSLLSICLSKKLGLTENGQMIAALAGLLHDIGELYVQPEYLNSKKRLLPQEWRHVVVHPRIGQMLIEDLENFPPAVALAVAEHHERFDGGGYPRQVSGKNISAAGQIVSVAEMISGVFMKQDKPLERAELALKVIPGEHAHELVSAISSALRISTQDQRDAADIAAEDARKMQEGVRDLYQHIASALKQVRELGQSLGVKSQKGKDLLKLVEHQVQVVQRAFSSTGLDVCLAEDTSLLGAQGAGIFFEVSVATREIQWRLRDVARNLYLRAVKLEQGEMVEFEPLIAMLDAG